MMRTKGCRSVDLARPKTSSQNSSGAGCPGGAPFWSSDVAPAASGAAGAGAAAAGAAAGAGESPASNGSKFDILTFLTRWWETLSRQNSAPSTSPETLAAASESPHAEAPETR